MLCLLTGAIAQADERECGHAALEMSLDVDAAGIEPDQRVRGGSREHVAKLDNDLSHVCDDV
jgi:hypothetical protein